MRYLFLLMTVALLGCSTTGSTDRPWDTSTSQSQGYNFGTGSWNGDPNDSIQNDKDRSAGKYGR